MTSHVPQTDLPVPDRFGRGKSVAVIGAGIAGVSAAAYLLKEDLEVTVFERASVTGGIWHYDERVSVDPPFPNEAPSKGDYLVSRPGEYARAYPTPPPDSPSPIDSDDSEATAIKLEDLEVRFAPPGPCYAGLQTNIPTNVLVSRLLPWPEGTELKISQQLSEKYIKDIAAIHGVDGRTRFNTRVEDVNKTSDGKKWKVRTLSLERFSGPSSSSRLVERIEEFDLVVAASGHYSTPRIPDFPGLTEWKSKFPSRLLHSKQYRRPENYRGQNVLVVGAGVSSTDICKELVGVANTVYQSVRGGVYDTPLHMLPASTIRVGEISHFSLFNSSDSTVLPEGSSIPGTVHLKSRSTLSEIHTIIFATGYLVSYPYLSQYHSDSTPLTSAGDNLLVTSEGSMVHNLHKDIFYISDPTLAFIGVPYHAATFPVIDFQSQVLARVFSSRIRLPSETKMREEYNLKVERKGLGRGFHSLAGPGEEFAYDEELIEWINHTQGTTNQTEGEEERDERIEPLSEEWKKMYQEFKNKLAEEWFGGEKREVPLPPQGF